MNRRKQRIKLQQMRREEQAQKSLDYAIMLALYTLQNETGEVHSSSGDIAERITKLAGAHATEYNLTPSSIRVSIGRLTGLELIDKISEQGGYWKIVFNKQVNELGFNGLKGMLKDDVPR